jgi:hypothetical protein
MNYVRKDRIDASVVPLDLARGIGDVSEQLLTNGFAVIDGIVDTESHIRVAAEFGTIERNCLGSFVHNLCVKTKELAHSRSLSAIHGSGMFPFHTDTAFWRTPCRLLTLRAVGGDLRRSTRIIRASHLLEGMSERDLDRACWIVNTGQSSFYTGLVWHTGQLSRFRLDLGCMKPANSTAKSLEPEMKYRCRSVLGLEIQWKPGRMLILDNWQLLHARSVEVENEGIRTLERIYLT